MNQHTHDSTKRSTSTRLAASDRSVIRVQKKMTFSMDRSRIDKVPDFMVLEELRRVAAHFQGQYFTGRDFDRIATKCKRGTVIRNYGSWQAGLKAAGLNLDAQRKQRKDAITETDLFAELERIWLLLDHRPSKDEWEASSPRFSYTTYKTRFSGWSNACARFIEYKSASSAAAAQPTPAGSIQPAEIKSILESEKRTIPLRLRLRVLQRDDFRCVICGRSPALTRGVILHIDHKVPFSAGGKTEFENLQTLCLECNLGKGSTL